MSKSRNVLSIVVFLLTVAMQCFGGDPEPAARIDLQPLGLKPATEDSFTDAKVRWWRQYIVVDLTYVTCKKCYRSLTHTETPGPRLVIDSTTGKQVQPEIVADAAFELNPQDSWYPNKPAVWDLRRPTKNPEGDILSQWKGMTVVRDKERKLWLQEPGHPNTLLFARNGCESAVFISTGLILLIGRIKDHPHSDFHQWVIDKTGALKYELSDTFAAPWNYFALSREGDRFAVWDNVNTKFQTIFDILLLGATENSSPGVNRVRVFAADQVKELFEYKWGRQKYEPVFERGIALSEDGTLLAVIKRTELLIFQVPSGK